MGNLFSKKNKGEKKKKNKKNQEASSDNQQQQEQSKENGSAVASPNAGDSAGSSHLHRIRVKAMYNFNGMSEDDLPFQKGDLLEVDESALAESNDWWYATHLTTKQNGYIPGNYVTKDDSTPQSQEWWFSVDRHEADKVLLLPGNNTGTFLVRDGKESTHFALSVLTIDKATQEPCVRHYRVKKMDDGEGCYITPSRQFSDLISLVEHYKSSDATGLCCILSQPCPRIRPPVLWRELEVKRDAVRLTAKLGQGCFGEVWKGKFRKVVDVAVKTLKPGTMSSEAFLEEAKIMHKLTHHRLVQLVAVVSTTEPFFIITELMVNGSLLDFLHSDKGKELKLPHMIEMNEQIAEGMCYLESQNNIHRDLRAANILVGEHYDVKIADFGLARILEDEIYGGSQNTKFPIKWTAPEAAERHIFSIKSDVWSFGVLMYEIITLGRTPYPGMNGHEVLRWIDRGGRMEKPRGPPQVPDEYYEMMLKCWNQQPDDRPTFESIFHFFSDYSVNIETQYKDVDAI
ncbi:tyrosine-protein kinase [Elysia marginata]|uniref:Tyrosine-protein kinase n=1 Tax=Elysia marginata TaxID=1093978 RepID=A0AAV4H1B8_9GAST|nr:tyrosine-protein kinase [Elysia marginata]